MESSAPPPTTSSGRRRPAIRGHGTRLMWVLASAVLLLVVGLELCRDQAPPAAVPSPTPAPRSVTPALAPPATLTPSPTATTTPSPALTSMEWLVDTPTPRPSPTPTRRPPRRLPTRTPTPLVSQCVEISWSATGTLNGLLLDIRATNHCRRTLEPLEVWFWAGGYRDGALVQSVRGHLFDPLDTTFPEQASLLLPGTAGWYDRIEVRVVEP